MPIEATYEQGLSEAVRVPAAGRQLVVFLGSNIGNSEPDDARALLDQIAASLRPGDLFLLGADLVKPEADLLLAYDDPLGVTAAFNRNLLQRMNTELGADFELATFAHQARWNAEAGRVEMHLVSRLRQTVDVPGAGMRVSFVPGESIWTESSHKYDSCVGAGPGRRGRLPHSRAVDRTARALRADAVLRDRTTSDRRRSTVPHAFRPARLAACARLPSFTHVKWPRAAYVLAETSRGSWWSAWSESRRRTSAVSRLSRRWCRPSSRVGATVIVEPGAGAAAGFLDAAYQEKGATIGQSRADVLGRADVVLRVRLGPSGQPATDRDLGELRAGQAVIAFLDPLSDHALVRALAERQVSAFSMELMPRITRAQSMDALSSMATIAGYKAVLLAAVTRCRGCSRC